MKITKSRETVRLWLAKNGCDVPFGATDDLLSGYAERLLEIGTPARGTGYSTDRGRVKRCAKAILGKKVSKGQQISRGRIATFYKSPEWRRARYDALAKNDGRCELCGRCKHDGVVLNVDHIRNLRDYWGLRLDPRNHQVLCGSCNHGKGNRDDTDWRQP